ncbi:hypothetical protein BDZ91DRAFT_710278 [Kalaharituber pfeilii]|nr:hypothetical protein BDZ91DRAFT_710278 [Kalaharituber pfeilii]
MAIWGLRSLMACLTQEIYYTDEIVIEAAVWGASFNIMLLILPIRPVWKLRVSWSKRIAISGIFAIASIACAFSFLRAYVTADQLSNLDNIDLLCFTTSRRTPQFDALSHQN